MSAETAMTWKYGQEAQSNYDGVRDLWAAVIQTAIVTVQGKGVLRQDAKRDIRKARAFLQGEGNLCFACACLDVDPGKVIERIKIKTKRGKHD